MTKLYCCTVQTVPDCETFTTPSIIFLDRKTGRPKGHIFKFAAEGWREFLTLKVSWEKQFKMYNSTYKVVMFYTSIIGFSKILI